MLTKELFELLIDDLEDTNLYLIENGLEPSERSIQTLEKAKNLVKELS